MSSLDAGKCWSEQPIVVCDVETTGVSPETCGVVSIAAVLFEDKRPTKRFYSLVNPGCEIPESASAIHGIKAEHIKDAPRLEELAGELLAVAGEAQPCGYNGQAYDRIVLRRHISGSECPLFFPMHDWVDPLTVIRDRDRYVAGKKRHTLSVTCKRWGVELDDAHNALSDCLATGALLYKLLERGVLPPMPLDRLISRMLKRQVAQEQNFQEYVAKNPQRESA